MLKKLAEVKDNLYFCRNNYYKEKKTKLKAIK